MKRASQPKVGFFPADGRGIGISMSKRNIAGTGRKQAEEAGSDSWLEFRRGIGAGVPLLVGYLPISVAFGVIAAQGNIPLGHAVAMSALVFAGASQFLAVNMIASGAGTAAVVLATFMINLRHLIMSLSLMSQLRPSSRWIRAAASFGITDETFAVASMEAEESKHPLAPAFLFGLILMAYGSWVTGTWLGGVAFFHYSCFGGGKHGGDAVCHVYRFVDSLGSEAVAPGVGGPDRRRGLLAWIAVVGERLARGVGHSGGRSCGNVCD